MSETGEHSAPPGPEAFERSAELAEELARHNQRTHPEDPEFIEIISKIRETEKVNEDYWGAHEQFFGQEFLADIEMREDPQEDLELNRGAYEDIEKCKTEIIKLAAGFSKIRQEIISTIEAAGIAIPEQSVDGYSDDDYTEAIVSNLSAREFIAFLRQHHEIAAEQIESMEAKLPTMQENFQERLQEGINSGAIPITLDTANKRLARSKIRAFDPWLKAHRQPSGGTIQGSTSFYAEEHSVDSSLDDEQAQEVVDHESFHVLAGHTSKKDYTTTGRYDEPLPDIDLKAGLAVTKSAESSRHERFRWLDEAVTDQLTLEVGNNKASLTYEDERYIIELLMAGVSKDMFYQAYFEDFDSTVGTPSWGKLQNELSASFEPRILLTLDKMIQQDPANGMHDAYDYLWDLVERRFGAAPAEPDPSSTLPE